jgi:hypothetical protein
MYHAGYGVRLPQLPLLYVCARRCGIRKRQLRLPHSIHGSPGYFVCGLSENFL